MRPDFQRRPWPVLCAVSGAWLVLLVGVVDAVRWLFGADLWLTLPVLNAATAVVIVSELIFWLRRKGRAALESPEGGNLEGTCDPAGSELRERKAK